MGLFKVQMASVTLCQPSVLDLFPAELFPASHRKLAAPLNPSLPSSNPIPSKFEELGRAHPWTGGGGGGGTSGPQGAGVLGEEGLWACPLPAEPINSVLVPPLFLSPPPTISSLTQPLAA